MQEDSWNVYVCVYIHGVVEQETWLSVSHPYDPNYYKYWHDSVRHYSGFT